MVSSYCMYRERDPRCKNVGSLKRPFYRANLFEVTAKCKRHCGPKNRFKCDQEENNIRITVHACCGLAHHHPLVYYGRPIRLFYHKGIFTYESLIRTHSPRRPIIEYLDESVVKTVAKRPYPLLILIDSSSGARERHHPALLASHQARLALPERPTGRPLELDYN